MAEETLREQVKFALHCQPGQTSAALDGDAYAIHQLAHLAHRVPPVWLDWMMEADLYREHPSAADDATPRKGVNALKFHEWVASLVSQVDPSFDHSGHHQSRSKNARALHTALAEWASKKTIEAHKDEDEVIEINV